MPTPTINYSTPEERREYERAIDRFCVRDALTRSARSLATTRCVFSMPPMTRASGTST